MKKKNKEDLKAFTVRLPVKLNKLFKLHAVTVDKTYQQIIRELVEKHLEVEDNS